MPAENPLRCPKCHSCNLIKTSLGGWRCPHCGDPFQKTDVFYVTRRGQKPEQLLHPAVRGDQKAIQKLIEYLDVTGDDTAEISADILIKAASYSAQPVLNSFIEKSSGKIYDRQRERFLKIIVQMQQMYSDAQLIKLFPHLQNETEILQIIPCLETRTDLEIFQFLVSLLSHESEHVKKMAVITLGMLKKSDALNPLIHTYRKTGDPAVREEIIKSVIRTGHPDTVAFLNNLLAKAENDKERSSLVRALSLFRDPRSNEILLLAFTQTSDRKIKKQIITRLQSTADTSVVDSIIRYLETTPAPKEIPLLLDIVRKQFRSEYAFPLFRIFVKTPDFTSKKLIADILLENDAGSISGTIMTQLTETRDPNEVPLLLNVISKYFRKEHCIPLLKIFTTESDSEIKKTILGIITENGDQHAVRPLIDTLKSAQSVEEKRALISAIGKFQDPGANSALIAQFRKTPRQDLKKQIAGILSETGDDKTVSSLITILEGTIRDYERLIIIRTLGDLKNPRAVQSLTSMADRTKEADVKKAIQIALAMIEQSGN